MMITRRGIAMRWTYSIGLLLVVLAFVSLGCNLFGGGEKKVDQQELERKLAEVKANVPQETRTEVAANAPVVAAGPGAAVAETPAPTVRYEPQNRPDPFNPFKPEVITSLLGITDNPLLRYEVRYFKLVGIISSSNGPAAVFEDPQGHSYNVRVGDQIGKNAGVVRAITSDQVVIAETKPSWTEEGNETVEIVIWLRPEEHVAE